MSFTEERTVAEAMDWYQVHGVVEGYKKQRKILRHDLNFDDIYEVYYEQNVDSGYFRSEIIATRDIGRRTGADVQLAFDIAMYLRNTPTQTDEGWFGVLELNPIAKLVVELPGDKDKVTHQFFRRIWYDLVFRENFIYFVEMAEEELNRYVNEMRNFFGLEPSMAKTERLEYEPLVYGYI